MKVASLFSGIGAFELGFERVGFECVFQCEIDRDCREVLARHWPSVRRVEDVSDVERIDAVDLICGGFPCQDLSVAGKRAGLAGERSGLWFDFHRIIENSLPRWVVIENVPGLLSSNGGRDFAVILCGLVKCGYRVSWRILDAQYFGVAQRRRRVFIVGSLGDGRAAEILFEREGLLWNPAESRKERARVAACLDGSPYADRAAEESRLIACGFTASAGAQAGTLGFGEEVSPNLKTGSGGGGAAPSVLFWNGEQAANCRDSSLLAKGQTMPDKNRFPVVIIHENKSASITENETARRLRAGASHSYQVVAFRACGQDGFDVSGVAPPVAATDGGGANTPTAMIGGCLRRLTPRECERLQGLPDDFTRWRANGREISDSARYHMIGNSIAEPVVEWIARRIKEVLA